MTALTRASRVATAWVFLGPALALLFCMGVAYNLLEAVGERLAMAVVVVEAWSARRG